MSVLKYSARALRYLVFSLLVGTALAVSVIRAWIMPNLDQFRESLQSQIGAILDQPVRIQSLGGHVHGLNPVLLLKGFSILDGDGKTTGLRLGRVGVEISLLRSLLARRAVFSGLELEEGRVVINRRADGSLGILGLKGGGSPPLWLLEDGEIIARQVDLSWHDEMQELSQTDLGMADLGLSNAGGMHRLRGHLGAPGNSGGSWALMADISGNVLDSKSWRGRAYLEARNITEATGLPEGLLPIALKSGNVRFKLWGELQGVQLRQILGNVDVRDANLLATPNRGEARELPISSLTGSFLWRRFSSGWGLAVSDLGGALTGEPWPSTSIGLLVDQGPKGELTELRGSASYLRLQDVRRLLDWIPMDEAPWRSALSGKVIQGEVRDIKVYYQPSGGPSARWAVCGSIKQLGVTAGENYPGVHRLDANICGNDASGSLRVNARGGSFEFAKLWRQPITLDDLDSELRWIGGEQEWRLSGDRAHLSVPGADLTASFSLSLPKESGSSPFLDLRGTLIDVDAARVRNFLPLAAMPKSASEWLERAFTAGRVNRAEVLFHGAFKDFPFYGREGVFEVEADASQVDVDFDPEWPVFSKVDAHLHLLNTEMNIDATAGVIGGGTIRHAERKLKISSARTGLQSRGWWIPMFRGP